MEGQVIQSYPFYVNDWLASGTRAAMSAEQRGIYRDLLDACWRDGNLPIDEQILQRMAAASDREWKRSWPHIKTKFEERDGRLWNTKVDSKRPSVINAKESRRASSSHAARSRWSVRDGMRDALPDAQPTHPSRNASECGTPSPSPSPSPLKQPPTPFPDYERATRELIAAHYAGSASGPNFVSSALVDVCQPLPDREGELRRVLAAHAAWLRSEKWTKDGGKFQPDLARWIRAGGYKVEPPASSAPMYEYYKDYKDRMEEQEKSLL